MRRAALALLVGLLADAFVLGAEIRVAAAANFAPALQEIVDAFETSTGHRVVVSTGSTGKLAAQIAHGAPYDVFLAADAARPRQLETSGHAVSGSRFTYAVGRLALWAPGERVVDGPEPLRAEPPPRVAIANPTTAPYGTAARQVLERLGLWQRLAPDLVRGESVAQTYHFVASGNARLGLVALSQLVAAPAPRGDWWIVPQTLHDPIEQQAVLLKRAADNDAARSFLDFLCGAVARSIVERLGYVFRAETCRASS